MSAAAAIPAQRELWSLEIDFDNKTPQWDLMLFRNSADVPWQALVHDGTEVARVTRLDASKLPKAVIFDHSGGTFSLRRQDDKVRYLRQLRKRIRRHRHSQGASFKLSDYRGKVVLLNFWGHW